MIFNCLFLCNSKWILSTIFSGDDGFFDLTHVGTGERLNVQESWANKHPKDNECIVAYLGENKLSGPNVKKPAFQKSPSTTACTIRIVTEQTQWLNGIGL